MCRFASVNNEFSLFEYLFFSMYVVYLKITATFLWLILIFHSGYTSIILETVTIDFSWVGAREREPKADIWGPELRAKKSKYLLLINYFDCRLWNTFKNTLWWLSIKRDKCFFSIKGEKYLFFMQVGVASVLLKSNYL